MKSLLFAVFLCVCAFVLCDCGIEVWSVPQMHEGEVKLDG